MSRRHHPSAVARDARLALRAGTGLQQAWLDATSAALSAQLVIGQRMGQMMAAGLGLRPADPAEIGRMGSEKVEAGMAAAPALLGGWVGMQMQLLRFWQREALVASRLASSWSGPMASWRAMEAAAARATTAALRMTLANTAALTPVTAPWYGRVAANARRLAEAETRAAARGRPSARRPG